MLSATIVHPSELTEVDAAVWRRIAAAEPAFSSPLLGPDFARAVGAVRKDARVAIFRRDGEAVGFLPFHQRPGGFARPIGAPLSDYQALVTRPDAWLTGADAMAALDMSAFRFNGLVDPHGAFDGALDDEADSGKPAWVVQLNGSAEDYLESVRAASPKRFKNYRRLGNKLERDLGALRLVTGDTSQEAFDTLIAWKRAQFHRTGGHDVLRPDWTRELLQSLFARQDGDFRGMMICLYAGDRLIAGHFGVRLGAAFHPWIASVDPELPEYSPGQVFMWQAIAAMPGAGLTRYDLGPSHDHYKRHYALEQVTVCEGLAAAPTPAGRAAGARERAWSLIGGSRRGAMVGRLRGRLDAIAAVELSAAGRVMGVVEAFAAQTRRRTVEDV